MSALPEIFVTLFLKCKTTNCNLVISNKDLHLTKKGNKTTSLKIEPLDVRLDVFNMLNYSFYVQRIPRLTMH